MKTKLIALLSFLMILSLTAFACNKPANNSQKESENVSVEQSLQESETQSQGEESEQTSVFETF